MNRTLKILTLLLTGALVMPARLTGDQTNSFQTQSLRLSTGEEKLRQASKIVTIPYEMQWRVQTGDRLYFSYGVRPRAMKKGNKRYTFSIHLSGQKGKSRDIFSKQTNPKKNPNEYKWHNHDLSLNAYAGQTIQLRFESKVTNRKTKKTHIDKGLLTAWGGLQIGNFKRKKGEYNVILVSLDTLRADHLSINGYARNTSPHIDELARKGVFFQQGIAPSPWTLPSHMSLFTGLYPSFHGMYRDMRDHRRGELSSDIPTLPEYLQAQGYLTQAFTGNAYVGAHLGFSRGFNRYVETVSRTTNDAKKVFSHGFDWIRKNADKKFFLFLHTYEIHDPFTHTQFVRKNPEMTSREKMVARYDSGILYTDQYIGTLKHTLDELKLTKNTILIIVSDHGEELNQRGFRPWHGHSLYEELIRIPILFYSPRLFKRRLVKNYQAELIDILPTLLEGLNIEPWTDNIQGKSLWPILTGGKIPKESVALGERSLYLPEKKFIRYIGPKNRHKFILTPSLTHLPDHRSVYRPLQRFEQEIPHMTRVLEIHRGREFYDLEKDPGETQNLAPDKPTEMKKLEKELNQFITSFPLEEPARPATTEISPEVMEKLKSLGY